MLHWRSWRVSWRVFIINLLNTNINMCHFDNPIKLISLDNDCMFHFIFDVVYRKPCFIHIVWFQKISIPPTEGFFSSLTPNPAGFSIPESFALLPPPSWNFHDFSTWSPIPLGNSKSKKRELINAFWSS